MSDTLQHIATPVWAAAPFSGDTLIQNTGAQTVFIKHGSALPAADATGYFELEPGDSYDTSGITGACYLKTRYVVSEVNYQVAG